MGKSYLERLMDRPVYEYVHPSNAYCSYTNCSYFSYINLVKNFRSHEAILAHLNAQFYGGKLDVCRRLSSIRSSYVRKRRLGKQATNATTAQGTFDRTIIIRLLNSELQ